MDEEVWGAAAPRALEGRATGLKTLLMEEIVSYLRVLNAASIEQLEADDHDVLFQAMTRALSWLRRQIAQQVNTEEQKTADLSALKELTQVFLHWHKLQQTMQKPMSWKLWMLWTQLGCTLEVLRCYEPAERQVESVLQLLMTSRPPLDFPMPKAHCNKEKQVAFSCELWDTILAKPLYGASEAVVEQVAGRLVEGFLYWMATVMRGYESVFIANVATALREHLQNAPVHPLVIQAWLKFATVKSAGSVQKNAAGVAVTVVVLSALSSTNRTPEMAAYLESLSAATVDELSRGPFPQSHSPVGIVAMALGIAALDDARFTSTSIIPGNSTLLGQVALLRLVTLKLLSSRLKPYDDASLVGYQEHVLHSLKALPIDASHTNLQDISLRMVETCIEEVVNYYQSSHGAYLSLMEGLQSVLPEDLFRPKLLTQLQSDVHTDQDESLMSASEIVAFLKNLYCTVAPMLEVLASNHLVRAFHALSRLDFAREVCASSTVNASMQAVTHQLENALEQTPAAIFPPVLRSLAMHSTTSNSEIPPELDVVAGCQNLAVGLIIQRKLRVLLFQCTPQVDDALAVVFSGLYNVFEPADAFAHRFLGVCLSHLGQFTPLFTVFPYYLQVTLAAYPTNASQQDVTKACGAIFGSLFYSEALSAQDSEISDTAERMILWAIRKCCERSSELLAEDELEEGGGETDALYLAGLVFELLKMAPMSVLKASAMEAERLLANWKSNPRVLRELKRSLFDRISQNCEAEKRAWFAAWYIEIDNQYPVTALESAAKPATSRL